VPPLLSLPGRLLAVPKLGRPLCEAAVVAVVFDAVDSVMAAVVVVVVAVCQRQLQNSFV
jgi:hypothetical protein